MTRSARVLAALLICLTAGDAIAHRPPRTFITRHYNVTTDAEYGQAHAVARHMDAVYDEYFRGLPSFIDGSGRSNLYLSADRDGYIATLAGKGVNATFTGGIFFARPDETGLATWVGDRPRWQMISTLQHEGFHQFAHKQIGTLPPWVNEGLAEYFGNAVLVNGRLQTGRVDPQRLARIVDSIDRGTFFRIDTFVNMTFDEWNDLVFRGDERSSIMYDQAWSYVHTLIKGNRGLNAPLLEQYLVKLSEGLTPADAWVKVFGSNHVAFQEEWKRHVLSLEPDPLSTALERLDFLAAGLRLLHERDIQVQTLGELQQQLQAGQFRMVRSGHGGQSQMTAADAENFQGPPLPGRTRPAKLLLERSRNDRLPPTLRITDLPRSPRAVEIVWDRDDADRLVYDFDFK